MELHSFALRLAVACVACARAGDTCTVVVVLAVSVAVASALSHHGVAFVRLAAYGCSYLVLVLVALALRWCYAPLSSDIGPVDRRRGMAAYTRSLVCDRVWATIK